MKKIVGFAKRLWNDEEGQGMVEYGLILALIAIAAMFILYQLGQTVRGKYESINNQLETPSSSTTGS